MKLILFLAAVYALIFYQYYKIEKSKFFPPASTETYKSKPYYQYPTSVHPEAYVNADVLVRGKYLVYRHSTAFQLTRPLLYE